MGCEHIPGLGNTENTADTDHYINSRNSSVSEWKRLCHFWTFLQCRRLMQASRM